MGKGGGGARTPVEQADNLKSKQQLSIIDLLCEGQIEGPVGGLKGVYLNDTPIQNSDGSNNFSGVNAQWLAGTQQQSCLEGFSSAENEVPVSTEVKYGTPLIRTISSTDIDRVRVTVGVSALFSQTSEGDINGSSVELLIQVSNGSTWQTRETVKIEGKIRSQYLRSVFLTALPKAPFNIRVVRNTPDSTSSKVENKTLWSSYTEIIDSKLSYPNTALVGLSFDSSQFQGVPKRNYLIRGLMIKVPSNYTPETRTYSGMWDGSFKIAWSNNPAWIFYDLVMNERYGLGKRLGNFGCDKWAMYSIAQYCDVMVDDGFGNKEPRMTCNCYITDRRQAYEVVNDLASIFRAMPVWDGMQMSCVQDRLSDPVWRYTNTNVVDGSFSYQSSAQKARHTAAHVRYIDPANGWKTATEYVSDDVMIARYGLNVTEIDAFGCTSRGQARRTGQWILQTERLEKQSVSFNVGREGMKHLPGDIIEVVDNQYSGSRSGGRIKAISGRTITLDRDITIPAGQRAYLGYIGKDNKPAQVDIASRPQPNQVVLAQDVTGLQLQGVWTLSLASLKPRLFRAMSIGENDDGTYSINALQHIPEKEAAVDNGVRFDPKPARPYGGNLPPVEHLRVEAIPDSTVTQARAYWSTPTVNQHVTFEVKLTRGGAVVLRENTPDTQYLLNGLEVADYQISVRCRDGEGRLGEETVVDFSLNAPAPPAYIDVTPGVGRITLQPHFAGVVSFNTLFEFWYAEKALTLNQVESMAVKLVSSSYYIHDRLKHGKTYYYYVRSVNPYGKSAFIGVEAQTSSDASEILDVIADKVMSSELGKSLTESVEKNNQDLQEAANAIISNALANDADAREWRKKVGQTDAAITEVKQVVADGEQATATVLQQLTSKTDNTAASLTQLSTTVANNNSATSQQITGLNSQIGTVSADVQQTSKTVADLNGKLSASWNIKVGTTSNGKQYAAGIGVGVENTPSGMQSQVLFSADRFAFINTANGTTSTPFVIDGGQTIINSAFIKDGSITSAKIGDASITSAKIGSAQVDTLRIKDNSVIIPTSFTSTPQMTQNGNGNFIQMVSGSVYYPFTTRVIVISTVSQGYNNTNTHTTVVLKMNGQEMSRFYAGVANDAPVLMYSTIIGAGTYTFSLEWKGNGNGVTFYNANMAIWGAMR